MADTIDEIRDTNGERLTPAMQRWKEKIERGYSVRPALRRSRDGYLEWGPGLFNPDGAFVQNVRRDTFRQLMRLGIISAPGGDDERKDS